MNPNAFGNAGHEMSPGIFSENKATLEDEMSENTENTEVKAAEEKQEAPASSKNSKKKVIIALIALLAVIAAVVIYLSQGISATTMRILRIEGTVTLKDNGADQVIKENLRLKSGNSLETKAASLVSIGLDEAKIVTLNENSLAEFNQKGRKLDLELKSGSLFFDVTKPLTDDETFDIRTSTMVVGIRGTSGYVFAENGQEGVIICDGTVHVIGTNPVTGEVKETDVHAGEKLLVYLYDDKEVDSIEFHVESIIERQLSEFVLERLREDIPRLDKIVEETGWDKPWILGLVTDEEASAEPAEEAPEEEVSEPEDKAAQETASEPEAEEAEEAAEAAEPAEEAGAEQTAEETTEASGDADDGQSGQPGQSGQKAQGQSQNGTVVGNANGTANTASNGSASGNNNAASGNNNAASGNNNAASGNNNAASGSAATSAQLAAAQSAIASTDPATGVITLTDGTTFNPGVYAALYPDVVSAYGSDSLSLLAHYVAYGRKEGRTAYMAADVQATPTPEPVPSWLWLQWDAAQNGDHGPDPYSNDGGSAPEKPRRVRY